MKLAEVVSSQSIDKAPYSSVRGTIKNSECRRRRFSDSA